MNHKECMYLYLMVRFSLSVELEVVGKFDDTR